MEIHETQTEMPEEGASKAGFFHRLAGIYFEPKNTFESIDRKPSWVGIFIVMSILAIAANYTLMSRMPYQMYMRKALQMNPMTRNLPEEQVQTILSRPQSSFQRYSGMIFAPVGILIGYMVMAGIFLLLFVLMGASVTFKKSLAVTAWGTGPPSFILTILGIFFMLVKEPASLEINPANNVVSNLGPLVAERAHPVLNSILSSIDIFSFWTIFLLALGFAAVSERKLTTQKAAVGIIVLWVLWVAGKAGFTAIFS